MANDLHSTLRRAGLTRADLARLMNVDKATTTRWVKRRIPAERVLDVERITGISRHELRPDLYPRENNEAA